LFQELDFLCEAENSARCLINFRKLSPHIANSIYIPKVYLNLSSSRILTMEYMDAMEVTDVKGIKDAGIRPVDVSNLVSLQLFQNKCGNELFVDTHLTVM
jgi:aarF domain-containing kinase